jgi:hypothetical protein
MKQLQERQSIARVKSKFSSRSGCEVVAECGVRVESKTALESKWSPNLYRVSPVFS